MEFCYSSPNRPDALLRRSVHLLAKGGEDELEKDCEDRISAGDQTTNGTSVTTGIRRCENYTL